MHSKNNAIMGFLNYYANMTAAPQYAVMLKGRWGVGKTWFVEKFVDQMTSDGKKVLYVSLYGMTQIQQIEDEFFRQLHPVLSSKTVAFAGRLIKGVVKGALKIDLDRDGTDDGTMTVGAPDLGLPEYLRNTNGLILVFDDLERCSMPVADVLGYINYFVEHDGRKVVVVCNEEVLIGSDTSSENAEKSYLKIKEKLIGKTFSIEPDFDAAINKFLEDVNLELTRELLAKQIESIKRIYVNADYKNLRHLRQAILDFSRLIEVLDAKLLKEFDLMEHLLRFFLLFSFEIKSGRLLPAEISLIGSSLYKGTAKTDGDENDSLYRRLSSKYGDINIMDMLLSASLWKSIFDSGLFDATEINAELSNSRYLLSQTPPLWVALWNVRNFSDNEVDALIVRADSRLRGNEVESLGELKHIVSSLLNLSKDDVYRVPPAEIISLGICNVKKMAGDGLFVRKNKPSDIYERQDSGFGGYGYHEEDMPEFKDFVKQANEIVNDAIEAGLPVEATELLQLMLDDVKSFTSLLVHNNYKSSEYYGVPILSFIDEEKFVEGLGNMNSQDLMQIDHMIRERYSSQYYRDLLNLEAPWLRRTATALSALVTAREGKYSGVLLKRLGGAMRRAADELEAS